MEDLLAELDDDDEPRAGSAAARGTGGVSRGASRRPVTSDAVANARRTSRLGRVVALALALLIVAGTWWFSRRDDELPWEPTTSECETYLGLDELGQADWIERSIEASWPGLREELTVSELRTIMQAGFATCAD